MRAPVIFPSASPPVAPVLVADKPVAAAPAALPAGAGVAAGFVAVAVLAGLGIGWNSLGPKDQAKAVGAVTGFFTDQVSSGKMTLGQVGGLISGLLAGGSAGAAGVLQRNLNPTQRKELERTVMLAAYQPPSLERLTEVMDNMEFFQGCKTRPREELEGKCGDCSIAVIRELRRLGIRATFEPVENGAHGYVRVLVQSGGQILAMAIDCMIGTYSSRDNPRRENTFFGPESIYRDILRNIRRQ